MDSLGIGKNAIIHSQLNWSSQWYVIDRSEDFSEMRIAVLTFRTNTHTHTHTTHIFTNTSTNKQTNTYTHSHTISLNGWVYICFASRCKQTTGQISRLSGFLINISSTTIHCCCCFPFHFSCQQNLMIKNIYDIHTRAFGDVF